MKLTIDFSEPVFARDTVLQIQPTDLNDFYTGASDFDKNNIFFMLLTSLHHYEDLGDKVRAAHLSFLAACYLFIALTPPGSCLLALHYIKKAIALHDTPEYRKWLALMEKGN